MNPRTHPRGAPPNFSMEGLPPNPRQKRVTNALWWLIQMRLLLEPRSQSGGDFANKKGYHNAGENLENHGPGDMDTDHSIRWPYDREGPWWLEFASAHDWTFDRAHSGNYTEIALYTGRLIRSMRDPNDLRPDNVYAYTIGQANNNPEVEGYHERTNQAISGDKTHLWHRHDSFRRNIVGSFSAMWKALTIDMGWTYAEWLRSTQPVAPPPKPEVKMDWDDKIREGETGDTGGDWRTFRQWAADTQNERNWNYAGEATSTVNPPPTGSRIALLHGRVKQLVGEVDELGTDMAATMEVVANVATASSAIKAQVEANGAALSRLALQVDDLNAKLDRVLALLEPPASE